MGAGISLISLGFSLLSSPLVGIIVSKITNLFKNRGYLFLFKTSSINTFYNLLLSSRKVSSSHMRSLRRFNLVVFKSQLESESFVVQEVRLNSRGCYCSISGGVPCWGSVIIYLALQRYVLLVRPVYRLKFGRVIPGNVVTGRIVTISPEQSLVLMSSCVDSALKRGDVLVISSEDSILESVGLLSLFLPVRNSFFLLHLDKLLSIDSDFIIYLFIYGGGGSCK